MDKVKIINYDNWYPYDGASEGSGRGEKIWLKSPNGETGLFKYPKIDTSASGITTEHISEHLAYQIGKVLRVPTAHVEIGMYQERMGCMSYAINKPDEIIVEGAVFITRRHPDYDVELLQEKSSGRYYCLNHLLEISNSPLILVKWIQMMLFDFVIGNTDRHQSNWAFLGKYNDDNSTLIGNICPLYDNGSSLCCYVKDEDVDEYLGNDVNRFNSLVDTKSRSMIRIDGFKKKRPTHAEVITKLMEYYEITKSLSEQYISILSREKIDELMDLYIGVLSDKKIKLLKKYLEHKMILLRQILDEVNK